MSIREMGDLVTKYPTPQAYVAAYCIKDSTIIAKALVLFITTLQARVGIKIPASKCITISAISFYIFQTLHNSMERPLMAIAPTSSLAGYIKKA